jgi:DNA (cytosine-5)-methyltransferase 1
MGRALTYGSVCSGVEAATVAWHQLGWKPEWFSEIETFPSAVLQHHYPNVPNRGDMTKFKEWPDGSIDILVGGTPCQSFSVAGLRKGLDDPRGNLMLTYLALAARYRPRWLVWENVSGVLSSNKGRDFGTFLGALGECGYGFAYRVLDAQYFGVAQRRRRVFVIGYLGNWQRAAAVLFERDSLQGNIAPRRQEGEKVATTITRGFGDRGVDADQIANGNAVIAKCLTTRTGGAFDPFMETMPIAFATKQQSMKTSDNVANTLGANDYKEPQAVAISDSARTLLVRRLTPMECERLQGFPDGYTDIRPKGKPTPDGPRYKAMGNSMAVPVMRWIGERIQKVEDITQEGSA